MKKWWIVKSIRRLEPYLLALLLVVSFFSFLTVMAIRLNDPTCKADIESFKKRCVTAIQHYRGQYAPQ
ncbi:hypothetical protein [Providencia stuartii]|uniref:hypothetical protein n=1 Tax=Providencia stuartii TaxID=588 RepID=UPI00300C70B9